MNSPRVIDLNGPEGNIFAVVGLLIAECKKVGTEPPKVEEILSIGEYEDIITHIEEAYSDEVLIIR